ncbi:hypothetical protein [Selenomonas ruminantium]|uniref:hypothetical protein n=1 Tax=Selenomonas ruminantium TaxID=971 RepID=UPI0026EA9215|nr:hypothetical protein [Selenomonas ruminantium]
MTEEEIKAAFVTAFNKLVTEREEIVANATLVRQTLCDTAELEREKAKARFDEVTEAIVERSVHFAVMVKFLALASIWK